MPEKNQIVQMKITALSSDGNGVGRLEGMAVFVPHTAVGDLAQVRIVKLLKHHAYGRLEQLIEPSAERADPACPVYRRCGGCSLRHLRYETELAWKARFVEENLRRIGGLELPLEPILPSPLVEGYRNKAQYPIRLEAGEPVAGFFQKRSHQVIPWLDCALQPPFYGDILRATLRFLKEHRIPIYDEVQHKGLVRHLYLRHAEATGQVMVCLVLNGETLPWQEAFVQAVRHACPAVHTVVLNHNMAKTNVILGERSTPIFGDGAITDRLCGLNIRISPLSFYQVNRQSAENLYRLAAAYAGLTGKELLIDLYCGTGTIGLSMANRAARLIGVEVIAPAVEDARRNAEANGITNAEFFCGDAGKIAARLQREQLRPGVVILDPPRKGLDEAVIDAVCAMKPDRVVMVSCNSATAARDCRLFANRGYTVTRARPVDMFPRTAHVEAVLLLTREDSGCFGG